MVYSKVGPIPIGALYFVTTLACYTVNKALVARACLIGTLVIPLTTNAIVFISTVALCVCGITCRPGAVGIISHISPILALVAGVELPIGA